MFKAVTMNEFFFLPRLDLGRLWRWLKVAPVRPNSQEQSAVIVATIADRDAHEVYGDVYQMKDGRLFYAPVYGPGHPKAFEPQVDSIEALSNPHPDILASDKGVGRENVQDYLKLRLPAGESNPIADPAIKAAVVRAYFGKKAPQKLAELSLA